LHNFYFKDVKNEELAKIRSKECEIMLYELFDNLICGIGVDYKLDRLNGWKHNNVCLEMLSLLKGAFVINKSDEEEFRQIIEKILDSLPSRKDELKFKKSTIKYINKVVMSKLIKGNS